MFYLFHKAVAVLHTAAIAHLAKSTPVGKIVIDVMSADVVDVPIVINISCPFCTLYCAGMHV